MIESRFSAKRRDIRSTWPTTGNTHTLATKTTGLLRRHPPTVTRPRIAFARNRSNSAAPMARATMNCILRQTWPTRAGHKPPVSCLQQPIGKIIKISCSPFPANRDQSCGSCGRAVSLLHFPPPPASAGQPVLRIASSSFSHPAAIMANIGLGLKNRRCSPSNRHVTARQHVVELKPEVMPNDFPRAALSSASIVNTN